MGLIATERLRHFTNSGILEYQLSPGKVYNRKIMATDLEKIKTELMALPPESRAMLAQSLIESLDNEFDPAADALWLEEIRRRDLEIRNGTAKTKPAEQVLQEARDRLRCSK